MKKIIYILITFLIILTISIYLVYTYRVNVNKSQKINNEYKSYYNMQMLGTELVSILNKTADINEKNNIQKDANGIYINNDDNSIKLYIKLKYKNDYRTIEMEKILKDGVEKFIKTYGAASFKCTDIKYHEKTNNVKELTFTETDD